MESLAHRVDDQVVVGVDARVGVGEEVGHVDGETEQTAEADVAADLDVEPDVAPERSVGIDVGDPGIGRGLWVALWVGGVDDLDFIEPGAAGRGGGFGISSDALIVGAGTT